MRSNGTLLKFLLRNSGNIMAQPTQGSGGAVVTGGVQETGRCGTEGHGSVLWWGGLTAGLDDLRGLVQH